MHLLGELARAVGGERAGQEGADLGRLGVELRAKRSGVLEHFWFARSQKF